MMVLSFNLFCDLADFVPTQQGGTALLRIREQLIFGVLGDFAKVCEVLPSFAKFCLLAPERAPEPAPPPRRRP